MIAGISSLVVEDEYIIALEIQRVLESAGATAIIATPDAAGGASRTFDLAVIAVPPDRPALVELCRNLGNRGIAVVAVTSGFEPEGGGPLLAGVSTLRKPFSDRELLAAVTAALDRCKGGIS